MENILQSEIFGKIRNQFDIGGCFMPLGEFAGNQ